MHFDTGFKGLKAWVFSVSFGGLNGAMGEATATQGGQLSRRSTVKDRWRKIDPEIGRLAASGTGSDVALFGF